MNIKINVQTYMSFIVVLGFIGVQKGHVGVSIRMP